MQVILDVSDDQTPEQLDELLRNAEDEIVGVYIQITEGIDPDLNGLNAQEHARVCMKHNTLFGWYHFAYNSDPHIQASCFDRRRFALEQALGKRAGLYAMIDCEGIYNLGVQGVKTFSIAPIVYRPRYATDYAPLAQWIPDYFEGEGHYYRPTDAQIEEIKNIAQNVVAFQWTDAYMGHNQDASVVFNFDAFRINNANTPIKS